VRWFAHRGAGLPRRCGRARGRGPGSQRVGVSAPAAVVPPAYTRICLRFLVSLAQAYTLTAAPLDSTREVLAWLLDEGVTATRCMPSRAAIACNGNRRLRGALVLGNSHTELEGIAQGWPMTTRRAPRSRAHREISPTLSTVRKWGHSCRRVAEHFRARAGAGGAGQRQRQRTSDHQAGSALPFHPSARGSPSNVERPCFLMARGRCGAVLDAREPAVLRRLTCTLYLFEPALCPSGVLRVLEAGSECDRLLAARRCRGQSSGCLLALGHPPMAIAPTSLDTCIPLCSIRPPRKGALFRMLA